jgi:two-component system response regulator CpxR
VNQQANTAKILIIDDDTELSTMLAEFLVPENLAVSASPTGEDGLELLGRERFDLVILDIMMPGMNGIDVLKTLRRTSEVPVIMLTARGDDIDRILGLEFGADDYVSKPFNPRELLARIKAILRRARSTGQKGSQVSVGAIVLDVRRRQVSAGGAGIPLTGTEFEMLRCLAEAPGEVVTKETLSQQALGRRHMPYDRSIDTHISNVRGKLARAGVDNPAIQSRRGVGYCLVVDE